MEPKLFNAQEFSDLTGVPRGIMKNGLKQQLENLPQELLAASRWINVGTAANPKCPKVKKWEMAASQKRYNELRGTVGFVCSIHSDDRNNPDYADRDDYLLADADHVFNPDTGEFVNAQAAFWINLIINTLSADKPIFCEFSMSRTGFHFLARPTKGKFNLAAGDEGTLYFGKHDTPEEKKACPKLELFCGTQGRQVVLTGELYRCEKGAIIPSGERVDQLLETIIKQIRADLPKPVEKTTEKITVTKSEKPKQPLKKFKGYGISQETIEEVNNISAEQLETAGIVTKAPTGNYICLHCGSGTGEHQSGALAFDTNRGFTHWHCHSGSCDFDGNNIQLLAEKWHLDHKTDFVAIVEKACEIFNIPCQYSDATEDFSDADNFIGTKSIIRDCPVNLRLPLNFEFSNGGIKYIIPSKKENQEPKVHIVTRTPLVITKTFTETKTFTTQYEVGMRIARSWRYVTVDGRTLLDPRRILELTDKGALIEDSSLLAKFFARLIAQNQDIITRTKVYTQPGWHDGKFIYPVSYGENYICKRSNIKYDELFATSGDSELWKKQFQDAIKTNGQSVLKIIVLGAAFASPCLKIFHLPNFWLHLQGAKNSAKTLLLKLAMSAYGNPAETYLLRSFDSSPKNRVTMAVAMNDLPQAMDELETLSSKETAELQKSIYDYCSGMDGQKNQKNGDVREVTRFRGVRISTGERPILEQNAKGGAIKRCITLHIDKPLFDDETAYQLYRFCETNYGHFGKRWTEYIADHADEILSDYENILAALRPRTLVFEPTHVRAITACSVAFWHFRFFLQLDQKFERSLAESVAATIIHDLPTLEDISDVKRGIDLLASWIDEHPKNFIQVGEKTDSVISAVSFTESSGIKFTDGKVAFFPNAFRRICDEELHLPSYAKFLTELFDEGKLICKSRRDKSYQVWFGGENHRTYLFKAGVLAQLTDEDQEEMSREDTLTHAYHT